MLKQRWTLLQFFGDKVECCFDIVAGVDGPLDDHQKINAT